jgi:hypothetical protein
MMCVYWINGAYWIDGVYWINGVCWINGVTVFSGARMAALSSHTYEHTRHCGRQSMVHREDEKASSEYRLSEAMDHPCT